VHDQLGRKVGQVERVFAPGGDGDAMWVTVDASGGLFKSRIVLLRDYYGVDRGDLELRTDNDDSYAAQVPDDDGEASRPIS
jgi:hypothetical protein